MKAGDEKELQGLAGKAMFVPVQEDEVSDEEARLISSRFVCKMRPSGDEMKSGLALQDVKYTSPESGETFANTFFSVTFDFGFVGYAAA